ncbi:MAG: hypothetical protein KGH84_15325 [Paracoccaceae bacterium]|nr:hypothetical protein [Paracoccaceae bacterium]
MARLIWIGAAIVIIGIIGLLYCAIQAMRLRQAGLPDAELRAKLQRLVAYNFGALGVGVIGLMTVVLGIAFR